MKKFRAIFYPIYLLTIIAVIVLSININESLMLLKEMGWVRYFSDLPYYGRNLLLFLSGLMLVEFVVNNIQIIRLKKSIKS